MNILVVGGTGLIGSAVVARLIAHGHRVTVASRRPDPTALRHVAVDLARIDEAAWRPLLRGIEGVVNCAGVLQDAPGELDGQGAPHRHRKPVQGVRDASSAQGGALFGDGRGAKDAAGSCSSSRSRSPSSTC